MKRRLKITFTKVKRTNAPAKETDPPASPDGSITDEEIEMLRRIGMRHLDEAHERKTLPEKDD